MINKPKRRIFTFCGKKFRFIKAAMKHDAQKHTGNAVFARINYPLQLSAPAERSENKASQEGQSA